MTAIRGSAPLDSPSTACTSKPSIVVGSTATILTTDWYLCFNVCCCKSCCFAVVYPPAENRILYYPDSTFLLLPLLISQIFHPLKCPLTPSHPMLPDFGTMQRIFFKHGSWVGNLSCLNSIHFWSRNSVNRYQLYFTNISSKFLFTPFMLVFPVTCCFVVVVFFVVSPCFLVNLFFTIVINYRYIPSLVAVTLEFAHVWGYWILN